jgi:hypothetical protein
MSYAGPVAVMREMIAVWESDAALQAQIKARCGSDKSLRYFIGVDTQKLPSVALAPYILFKPTDYQRAADRASLSRNIQIGLVISDDYVDRDTTRTEIMRGLETLEILVPMLDTSLDAFFESTAAGVVDFGQVQTDIFFPEFRAEWAYVFTERYA